MEDIHNFIGGLHSDFDEQNQPKNTYRSAYNWIRLEDGSLKAEDGTKVVTGFPNWLTPKGTIVLGEELIIFSVGEDGIVVSQVGIVDSNNVYTSYGTTNGFGITEDSIITGVARRDYRNHRIVYFIDINGSIPARRIDLDSSSTFTDENSRLFLDSKMPIVTVDSITEDGNLPSGVYQASVRLLTSSLNKTTPSLISNIIPVVDESRAGGTDNYDGSLPQTATNKSINITVSNLDTKYKFVELIMTTYESLTNTLVSYVVDTKTILGDSVSFKYSSVNQHKEEVTLDEITIEPITYTSPKTIEQKDGRLILGNLKSRKYDSNFQAIANQIVAKYVIKELDYQDTVNIENPNGNDGKDISSGSTIFNNYNDELNTTHYKGYQRDEVYSFAITPIYKDLSYGYSYHIPGTYNSFTNEAQGPIGTTPADTTTKRLGFFKLQDTSYPTGFGYPEGNVCYHKMPTIAQEPIVVGNKIRVLGVEFANINIVDENIIGYAITRELRTDENKSILAQGIVSTVLKRFGNLSDDYIVSEFVGKPNHLQYADYEDINNPALAAFYSPETTIYRNNISNATTIEPVAIEWGASYIVGNKLANGDEYVHAFINYDNLTYSSLGNSVALKPNVAQYIPAESGKITPVNTTYSLDTKGTNGFVLIESNDRLPIWTNPTTHDLISNGPEIQYTWDPGNTSILRVQSGGFYVSPDTSNWRGQCSRKLFNLKRELVNQYGNILDKEYILVGHKLLDGTTSIECFGGDIFITKTAIASYTNYHDTAEPNTVDAPLRTLNYFFCESTINSNYRHNSIVNGAHAVVPYYPKYKVLGGANGILQFLPEYGHAAGYNKQYSFENTLKKFYSKSILTEEEVTEFSNRVIYSEQSIEGEQFDAYRLFLHNNYQDIPKNKGEITNLFTFRSTLYAHTSQSLWRLSFNEQITQVTSVGEVSLGNGGVFSRPPIEMFPQNAGYAGSVSPLATVSTPYGQFFVDKLQGKPFLFGESFNEISSGLDREFRELLSTSGNLIATYDYKWDRIILTDGSTFTLSYSPKLKTWTSYHDYLPTVLASVNQRVFLGINNNLSQLNVGSKGEYFDSVYPSTISIISNDNPLVGKTYDNITTDSSEAFTNLEVSDSNKTIIKELVNNDDWDFEPSSTQSRITKKNGEYRLSIPLSDDDSRIKGKYSSIKLDYSNLDNKEFIVKYIKVNYRINAR